MIPLFTTKNINDLLDVVTHISNEVSHSGGGIFDMLKYFSNNLTNKEEQKVIEKAIQSVQKIHLDLDNIMKICNDSITYLSNSINEGDDLK